MIELGEQAEALRGAMSEGLAWLASNSLAILIAVLAGAVLVAILLGVRSLGVWLGQGAHQSMFRVIACRVIGKTQIWFIVALAAAAVADLTAPPPIVANLIRFVFVVSAALQGAIWLRELILGWVEHRAAADSDDTSALASALGIIRLLVSVGAFALAAILILDNLGVNVTALVAGLGIGGIAIGLAAQGIFSDLFAALSILFDKPFRKGDTIGWGGLVGRVEAIGLKTTRVRALTGERVVVSNANLLNQELTNLERLERRRITFSLTLVYQTPPALLEEVAEILRALVESHEKCTFIGAGFVAFGASSLDHELIFDVTSEDFDEVRKLRTSIAIGILRTFAEKGIEFAYPTQTTFTAAPDGRMIMPYPAALAAAAVGFDSSPE